MNSIVTRDNSIAIENIKKVTQVSKDKCFYVATKFLEPSQLKKGFLLQQRKPCRDIVL